MQVFISWAGGRSEAFARVLREFIPQVIQLAQVTTSVDVIQSGHKWFSSIHEAVASAEVAIICITEQNQRSPWLHFEAGAISTRGIPIVPFLIDLSPVDLELPLAAFQAATADHDGALRLIQTLNARAEKPIAQQSLLKAFDAFWPDLERQIADLPLDSKVEQSAPAAAPSSTRQRSERDLLEEILALTRAIANSPTKGDA